MIVKKNVTVSIDKDRNFFISKNKIETDRLPAVINKELNKIDSSLHPAIIINADKTDPVEDIVKVMNIAKTKKITIVLQTQPE